MDLKQLVIGVNIEELNTQLEELATLADKISSLHKDTGLIGAPFVANRCESQGPCAASMMDIQRAMHAARKQLHALVENTSIYLRDVQRYYETADGRIADAIAPPILIKRG